MTRKPETAASTRTIFVKPDQQMLALIAVTRAVDDLKVSKGSIDLVLQGLNKDGDPEHAQKLLSEIATLIADAQKQMRMYADVLSR